MPTISAFYGIIIQMFYGDHAPPHIHVKYGEYKAVIDFQKQEVTHGSLPRRATNLVLDWVELHQAELMDNYLENYRNFVQIISNQNLLPLWSKLWNGMLLKSVLKPITGFLFVLKTAYRVL
ncbi:DUF4160 domain-containing protein [Oceanospirillum sediminis]|uniref:DUF4160 domain-containing protein n=1 Tax=Oceanospirillum sediminis TaxID=2760088 RepID=UPI001C721930